MLNQNHFEKACLEVGKNGDNDTLPRDIDDNFVKTEYLKISNLCFQLYSKLEKKELNEIENIISRFYIWSERLLVTSGTHGFRITTKIHPFWNIYLNAIGFYIAEKLETERSERVYSYRLSRNKNDSNFFDRIKSWKSYKEATLLDKNIEQKDSFVVQTDISSFYEHIDHKKLKNRIDTILGEKNKISIQVKVILSKIMMGRSFGLPVGGQFSRFVAEAIMMPVDDRLNALGISWHRYVDDYTIVCEDKSRTYEAISHLSLALSNIGLSLNKTKTSIISSLHYVDCVKSQFNADDSNGNLGGINLYFDPYSDNPEENYESLKESVKEIDFFKLLNEEAQKSEPSAYMIGQISRTLQLQNPQNSLHLCRTILRPDKIYSFRAAWSKIMRGIYSIRKQEVYSSIFEDLDILIDNIINTSNFLLMPDSNLLHYLKLISLKKTRIRSNFVMKTFTSSTSPTIKRMCIYCWGTWKDFYNLNNLIHQWNQLHVEEQRMIYKIIKNCNSELISDFESIRANFRNTVALGFEELVENISFYEVYKEWTEHNE